MYTHWLPNIIATNCTNTLVALQQSHGFSSPLFVDFRPRRSETASVYPGALGRQQQQLQGVGDQILGDQVN